MGVLITAALVYVLYRAAHHMTAAPLPLEFVRVTGSGDIQQADISPDGKFVAYLRETEGKQSLWLKQLATGSDVPIATLGEDQCSGMAFSPDGSYVYFVRQDPLKTNGDLYQVPSLGGAPRKMLTGISGPPAFSPDGQRAAFVRDTPGAESLLTASLDGSGERVLASYKAPEQIFPPRVGWSPDGKTLAFTHYTPQRILTTIPAEGGPAEAVAGAQWREIKDLTWLPGSDDLIVVGLLSGSFQLYEVSPQAGEVRQLTRDLSRYKGIRSSAEGKILLALQEQILATLQLTMPGKESEAKILSAGNQNRDGDNGLAWTPEGKIVYASVPNGRYDLWEMDADGSNRQRLTNNDEFSISSQPAASPAGGFVAYTRYEQNGQYTIWRIDLDGTHPEQLTQGKEDLAPAISPDGRWVIFAEASVGKTVLMKVPSQGGSASQLTDYNLDAPSISPDGKWIACLYSPTQSQGASLAILPFAGGEPVKVFPLPATATILGPRWTPDGRALSFIKNVGGVGNIWEQPVEGGPPKQVTHFSSERIFRFDWFRDGRLAISRGADQTDAVLIKNFR